MIKAIIFDWAGVIGVDGLWVWMKDNVKNLEERRAYLNEINDDLDSGRMPHSEFMQYLSKESGKNPEQIWQEVKKEIVINKELVEFIKTLKPKYKVGLLSNFTYPWISEILTENNLWELFDQHVISSEHKIIKPNPEIFHKMLEMLDIKPKEAIFVDDRQMHIDGAGRVGITGILFTNNAKFIEDLKSLGITA